MNDIISTILRQAMKLAIGVLGHEETKAITEAEFAAVDLAVDKLEDEKFGS